MKRMIRVLALAAWLSPLLAYSADEVKLIRANSSIGSKYGFTWQNTGFDVKVKDLGYEKSVSIRYRDADGSWRDSALSFSRKAEEGREIWTGNIGRYRSQDGQPLSPIDLEYAIRYTVNGTDYWDNNQGANYRMAANAGENLYDVEVYNNAYYPVNNYFYGNLLGGTVVLRNIAPHKEVQVHYSTDNWQTVKVAQAQYSQWYWMGQYAHVDNPSPAGFEIWSYYMDVGSANQVEYAIKYKVDGQTYWDNNFGRNYRTTLLRPN